MGIEKMTLKQYLSNKGFKLKKVQSISYTTLHNIIRGTHYGHLNPNYKGLLPYYPTDNTINKLAKELGLEKEVMKKLIDNQFNYNNTNK